MTVEEVKPEVNKIIEYVKVKCDECGKIFRLEKPEGIRHVGSKFQFTCPTDSQQLCTVIEIE